MTTPRPKRDDPTTLALDEPLTRWAFAQVTGLSPTTVTQVQAAGLVRGQYPTAREWLLALGEYAASSRKRAPAGSPRDRLNEAQAAREELKLEVERGRFIDADILARAMAGAVGLIVTRLTAIAPNTARHCPDLPPAQLKRIQAIVTDACESARQTVLDAFTLGAEDDQETEDAGQTDA